MSETRLSSWDTQSHSGFYGVLALRMPLSLLQCFPNLRYRACVVAISVVNQSAVWNFDQLWFSVMVSICCKEIFFNEGCELHLPLEMRINIQNSVRNYAGLIK